MAPRLLLILASKENNVGKKLTLKKEILKTLSAEQLRKVAGGDSDPMSIQPASAGDYSVSGCNVL